MTASAFFDKFDRLARSGCSHFVVRNSSCRGEAVSAYKLSMLANLQGHTGFMVGEYDACGNVNLKIVPGRQVGMLDVYALSAKGGTIIVDVKQAESLS